MDLNVHLTLKLIDQDKLVLSLKRLVEWTKSIFEVDTKSIFENIRASLVGGFLFLFSKQYKNNFQKIELETSFQIIIFIFYVFDSHF